MSRLTRKEIADLRDRLVQWQAPEAMSRLVDDTMERLGSKDLFNQSGLSLLRDAGILRIRAGTEDHRFLGIWVVVVGDRVFVRPWNDKPGGWRQAFLLNPRGAVRVDDREIRVRARTVRGERLFDAVDDAYAEKYATRGSQKWVRGFRVPRRRKTTMELLPR